MHVGGGDYVSPPPFLFLLLKIAYPIAPGYDAWGKRTNG
jgi:hypothetical protein